MEHQKVTRDTAANKRTIRVGVIGLGLMGAPMARNVCKAGFPLVVYNRTPSKTLEFKAMGAAIAHSPKELAGMTDVVITMVTSPADVRDVLFGPAGVVAGAHSGMLVMDMSTIGPGAAKAIHDELKKYGIGFVDAPVTGSTPKAVSGELTIFVGGEASAVARVTPVLNAMGTAIHHVGPVGEGQAIKMVNNFLIASTIVTLSEGMLLADAMGLSRTKVADVLQDAPAISGIMKLKLPNYASRSYPLLFTMKNMLKDLLLAQAEYGSDKKTLPVFSKVKTLYRKAVRRGLANADFSEIIKELP